MPTASFKTACISVKKDIFTPQKILQMSEIICSPVYTEVVLSSCKKRGGINRLVDSCCREHSKEAILSELAQKGVTIIPALSITPGVRAVGQSTEFDHNGARQHYLRPGMWEVMDDRTAPKGFRLRSKIQSGKSYCPFKDDFKTPMTRAEAEEIYAKREKFVDAYVPEV